MSTRKFHCSKCDQHVRCTPKQHACSSAGTSLLCNKCGLTLMDGCAMVVGYGMSAMAVIWVISKLVAP